MMTDVETQSLDYQRLQTRFSTAAVEVSPAEAQALLCGLFCSDPYQARQIWLTEILPEHLEPGDLLLEETQQYLQVLFEQTQSAFVKDGIGFQLLLPETEEDMRIQAEALVAWCQSFLYGIGLAGVDLAHLDKEVMEGINDMTEITRLDLDNIDNDEVSELDLTEISEYIWVVVMMLREELMRKSA